MISASYEFSGCLSAGFRMFPIDFPVDSLTISIVSQVFPMYKRFAIGPSMHSQSFLVHFLIFRLLSYGYSMVSFACSY